MPYALCGCQVSWKRADVSRMYDKYHREGDLRSEIESVERAPCPAVTEISPSMRLKGGSISDIQEGLQNRSVNQ
eukprot:scaffold248396_cov65-Cyclotella_meneghiniana.AAC.6